MIITREWAMPNKDTFSVRPIGDFVKRHLTGHSVDPFACNCRWASITNDLNPDTKAKYHMDALEFLYTIGRTGLKVDTMLLDPPYSLRQMKEVYEGVGRRVTGRESQQFYGDLRNAVDDVMKPNGIVLSFGWNSIGMTKKRNYEIIEILLVCHGRAHNDTICVADRKIPTTLEELI